MKTTTNTKTMNVIVNETKVMNETTNEPRFWKIYDADESTSTYEEVMATLSETTIADMAITASVMFGKDGKLMVGAIPTEGRTLAEVVKVCRGVVYEIYLLDGVLSFEIEHRKYGYMTLSIELANGGEILPMMIMKTM